MHMTCLTTDLLPPPSLISFRGGTMTDRIYRNELGIEGARDPSPIPGKSSGHLPTETLFKH